MDVEAEEEPERLRRAQLRKPAEIAIASRIIIAAVALGEPSRRRREQRRGQVAAPPVGVNQAPTMANAFDIDPLALIERSNRAGVKMRAEAQLRGGGERFGPIVSRNRTEAAIDCESSAAVCAGHFHRYGICVDGTCAESFLI